MIELLLNAENALALGLLDSAEGTYRTVLEADPRNGIAAVGLSRVALERGDEAGALALARAALEIDPENATACRMVDRLEEVARFRAAAPVAEAAVAEAAVAGTAVAAAHAVASASMIRASGVVKVDQAGGSAALPASDVPDPAVPEHADDEADHADGIQAAAAAPPRAPRAASAHESSTDSQRPGPANPARRTQPDDGPSTSAAAPPTELTPPTPLTPPPSLTTPARPGLLRRILRRS